VLKPPFKNYGNKNTLHNNRNINWSDLLRNTKKIMYKIKNLKTGFAQYMNAKQTATFMRVNGIDKYEVEEMASFDLENFIYASIAFVMIFSLMFGFFWFGLS
jgi:hypothetical protein